MPEEYSKRRDAMYKANLAKGMSKQEAYDAAQESSARIYNAQHKDNPVTSAEAPDKPPKGVRSGHSRPRKAGLYAKLRKARKAKHR